MFGSVLLEFTSNCNWWQTGFGVRPVCLPPPPPTVNFKHFLLQLYRGSVRPVFKSSFFFSSYFLSKRQSNISGAEVNSSSFLLSAYSTRYYINLTYNQNNKLIYSHILSVIEFFFHQLSFIFKFHCLTVSQVQWTVVVNSSTSPVILGF